MWKSLNLWVHMGRFLVHELMADQQRTVWQTLTWKVTRGNAAGCRKTMLVGLAWQWSWRMFQREGKESFKTTEVSFFLKTGQQRKQSSCSCQWPLTDPHQTPGTLVLWTGTPGLYHLLHKYNLSIFRFSWDILGVSEWPKVKKIFSHITKDNNLRHHLKCLISVFSVQFKHEWSTASYYNFSSLNTHLLIRRVTSILCLMCVRIRPAVLCNGS